MPRAAQARAWWADVEDVRERIERKRERENEARRRGADAVRAANASAVRVGEASAVRAPTVRRAVREVRPGRHLMLVGTGMAQARSAAPGAPPAVPRRRRPRPRAAGRVGPRPDMVAAWAVLLGFALVLAAVLSAHG